MNVYKHCIRPLLFRLDAETAHNIGKAILQRPYLSRVLGGDSMFVREERLRVDLAGLELANPVGLGAGFDKDCDMVISLQRLGFGYIVVGSVMCDKRPGNPRPRMVRDPERGALYSCMGLPSRGLDYAANCLKQRRPSDVPIIVNFNGMGLRDYLRCLEVLQPLGGATEVSLFCPNRAGDEGDFLDPKVAKTLFEEVAKRKNKPVFVKIPGYVSEDERLRRLELVDCMIKYPVDGITITPESRVKEKRLAIGQGTLTGRPTFEQTLKVVQDVHEIAKDKCQIKASGGISTSEEAFRIIAAGASTVEVVTGFMYEGWHLARNINEGLVDLMDRHNIESVTALCGTGPK